MFTALLDFVEAHPTTVGLAVGALGLIVPVVRKWAWRSSKGFINLFRYPARIMAKLDAAEGREIARDREIAAIRHQLYPNGGSSLADSVRRVETGLQEVQGGVKTLEGHRRHAFIMQAQPALELNAKRNAILVSAAFGRLVRADAGGLRGLTYLQYFDGDRIDAFADAFMDVAQNAIPSEFGGFTTRIYANKDHGPREDRGLWEVRAVPITATGCSDVLYSATLHPVDAVARGVAERNKWN